MHMDILIAGLQRRRVGDPGVRTAITMLGFQEAIGAVSRHLKHQNDLC